LDDLSASERLLSYLYYGEMLLIIKDKKQLERPCKPCENLATGINVGNRLLEKLSETNDGVGLAANQIGIDLSVCVVNVGKPIVFVNPRISGKFGKSFFQEGCLSFPGDYVVTERWTNIVVSADNHEEQLIFSFDSDPLECVCVQHEIDHLNGITMHDRQVDMEIFDGSNY